ncbi:NADH-quinone oxidoreductase subunit C [Ktedonosporobacter rubrisoli]|uniref:NADH-quinone oxidoreductase subunit C n=1 Tax=Ktedonosporobacter rubrisoli TaxID=2509675 RepID=A0A4P6K004_KTERU|nr:NADH-quinone oxidoreductase subunit C [Ktedonosporobacter rubrisoli]QBD81354.1 NADH-quinone oxidoreductase subunit C [Ktedonosporobacter rubrisoli]
MDLVPRSTSVPSATTGYRDQNAALARDLAPIAQITGKPLAPSTLKGDFLALDIDREHLVAVCRFLRDQLGFDLLSCISGVDMLDHLESVYHVRSVARAQLLQVKVRLDHEKPEVDSVVSVWPTANWLERETYDMYGIRYIGHPDLRRMLLDDDFEGYPLLKSFHQVPFTNKPRATTQVDPNMAVAGPFQQQNLERVVQKKLGQGLSERLHPGTPTFGHNSSYQEEDEQVTPSAEGKRTNQEQEK